MIAVFNAAGCGKVDPESSPPIQPAETKTPAPSGTDEPELSETHGNPEPSEAPGSPDTLNGLQILFINVGKADSALITFGQKHFLVDTGSSESLPMLVGALRAAGVETLEGVFLSHTHEDHTGGLDGLLRLFQVKQIYASEITINKKDGTNSIDEKSGEAGKTVQRLKRKDTIILDPAYPGVKFSVAGPVRLNADDDNDNSLVLYLESETFSCLFAGDMQFDEERSLLDIGAFHPCTVLKVGNHGNPDASSPEFISAVSPDIAVISTDSSVDTDTPAPSVLSELSKAGSKAYVTQDAKTGIIVNVVSGETAVDYYTAMTVPAIKDIAIESIDRESELITLRNTGDSEVDLSHWWIRSERGGEMFVFPADTEYGTWLHLHQD